MSLNTGQEKYSYAIGMNVGGSLREQELDLALPAFLQGFQDVYSGGATEMSEEDMHEALGILQQTMRSRQAEKAQAASAKNIEAGKAFLEANKAAEGVQVTASGLQYKVLQAGTGATPKLSDTVTTHYAGTLLSGKEFDSSYRRGEPASFPVQGVIAGWTEALQLMTVGSKWRLYIPSELAYGERGAGQDIEPHSTLVFDIELLAIK